MKKIFALILPAAFFALQSFRPALHEVVYKVDTAASTVEWYAEKVTGKHNGIIKVSEGEIRNAHGSYTGAISFDMNSIEDKDMESPDYRAKLENHLKSADFFDASKYPVSKFVITSITPLTDSKTGSTHNVKGMLTIRDKTNEITFDASMTEEGDKVFSTGSAVVDRSKFDIKYGSKTFFADIGDKMIYDNFTLKFNIVANKQ